MAASAGYLDGIYLPATAATPSSADLLNGCDKCDVSEDVAGLDTTDFAAVGEHKEIGGEHMHTISISGHFIPADTAQARLTTAIAARGTVYFTRYPLGHTSSAGAKQIACLVTNFKVSADKSGTAKFDATLKSLSAATTPSTF